MLVIGSYPSHMFQHGHSLQHCLYSTWLIHPTHGSRDIPYNTVHTARGSLCVHLHKQYPSAPCLMCALLCCLPCVCMCACAVWELLTRDRPFRGLLEGDLVVGVCDQGLRPTFPAGCPQSYVALAQQCWSEDMSQRPRAAQVRVQHWCHSLWALV